MNPLIIVKDLQTLFPFMRAVLTGRYKMPWTTFWWVMGTLIYFISPIDIVPDLIPLLGLADDGALILLVLTMVHNELVTFRQAQLGQPQDTIIEAEIVEDDTPDKK